MPASTYSSVTQLQFARICRVNHGGLLGFCHQLPDHQDTVLQDSVHKHLYAVIGKTLDSAATANLLKSLMLSSVAVPRKSMR